MAAWLGAIGCEKKDMKGKEAADEVEDVREEADLEPDEHLEKRADSAEELRENQNLEENLEQPPDTAKEMREEMGLHPDKKPDPEKVGP
jgi:hypothetical protein